MLTFFAHNIHLVIAGNNQEAAAYFSVIIIYFTVTCHPLRISYCMGSSANNCSVAREKPMQYITNLLHEGWAYLPPTVWVYVNYYNTLIFNCWQLALIDILWHCHNIYYSAICTVIGTVVLWSCKASYNKCAYTTVFLKVKTTKSGRMIDKLFTT